MSSKTAIEWTDSTWSPIRVRVKQDAAAIARDKGYTSLVQIAEKMAGRVGQHCEHVSPECEHCYAGTNNHRCLPHNGTGLPYDRRSRDLVDAFVDEKALLQPLKWKPFPLPREHGYKLTRPRRIFVENQSDLFGDWATDEMLDRVFAVMALCPQHIFQVLTKRPERMLAYLTAHGRPSAVYNAATTTIGGDFSRMSAQMAHHRSSGDGWWPLPHVWLGVSTGDQAVTDERIKLLLQTPAAVRFISAEPLLGPLTLKRYVWLEEGVQSDLPWLMGRLYAPAGLHEAHRNPLGAVSVHIEKKLLGIKPDEMQVRDLDWVICGGESGPGARPMHPDWARSLRDQCQAAGVPFFFKQWGNWGPHTTPPESWIGKARKAVNWHEWPDGTWSHESGKKATGAQLDGREWKQFPEVRHGQPVQT